MLAGKSRRVGEVYRCQTDWATIVLEGLTAERGQALAGESHRVEDTSRCQKDWTVTALPDFLASSLVGEANNPDILATQRGGILLLPIASLPCRVGR